MRCEETRDLAAEIALGIADGEERAEALRHLSTCEECRRVVDRLSEVADDLLVVAPVEEPPAGFESRVVEAMGLEKRQRRRRLSLRWLAPRVGPALAAAAVTAAVMVGVYHDDQQTAAEYRGVLDEAGGQYFQAGKLKDETGVRSGVAFGYEGSPSWLFLTVNPAHRDEVRTAQLVTKDGRTVPLRSFHLDRRGSWGGAIPVKLYEVKSVRLLGEHPGEILQTSLR
jgi:hypothetical protein